MNHSLATARLTTPDNSLVVPRPTPAKAALHDNAGPDVLSGVVIEAAKRAYGKQGAAAAHLNKDEGNFSRDVRAGRTPIRELASLGPQFLAELGKELVEQFGPLTDPKSEARRCIREIEAMVSILKQFVEAA